MFLFKIKVWVFYLYLMREVMYRSLFFCSSQHAGLTGNTQRDFKTGYKNNNSTIFAVYGSEIEFVQRACSPAVSPWVTSFQLCQCFNLRTGSEPEPTRLTGWPQNGCSEAIKLSCPITEALYLTRAAIFSSRCHLCASWRSLIQSEPPRRRLS